MGVLRAPHGELESRETFAAGRRRVVVIALGMVGSDADVMHGDSADIYNPGSML